MAAILAWVQANWSIIITVLFALDQALAAIPGVAANSTFQLVGQALGWLKSLFGGTPPAAPPAA